jgi:hypothetical protein
MKVNAGNFYKEPSMEATISRKEHSEFYSATDGGEGRPGSAMKPSMAMSPQWYSGITKAQTPASEDQEVEVIDKGDCIEFVLPARTAQFTELSVIDTNGKLVWKTQIFNKNVIVWYKQTNFGKPVPKGRYAFCMKQDRHQVNGIIPIM